MLFGRNLPRERERERERDKGLHRPASFWHLLPFEKTDKLSVWRTNVANFESNRVAPIPFLCRSSVPKVKGKGGEKRKEREREREREREKAEKSR